FVPAWTQLRGVAHALRNWSEARRPLFAQTEQLIDDLDEMTDCIRGVIIEHANNKQRLGELQLAAERAEPDARRQLLEDIWDELCSLEVLRDLFDQIDDDYGGCRSPYLDALARMRSELRPTEWQERSTLW